MFLTNMRYRTINTTESQSGTRTATDASSGAEVSSPFPWTDTVVHTASRMWDDPTGGTKLFKSCFHLSYVLDDWSPKVDVYHSSDNRNTPAPGVKYTDANFSPLGDVFVPVEGADTMSGLINWIPVTELSTDQLASYVFNAYNQFVNGVTALDASTSIAESGETPQLFQIWQRRKGLASNLTGGFLNYSFGWKPLISDLRAIAKELRSFPTTVRKRLSSMGDGVVTRHYSFDCSDTIDNHTESHPGSNGPYTWQQFNLHDVSTVDKSRRVVVTIRAKVKPKLTGEAQDLLNKLGALGLIPSLSTVWSVTRLSFVVDWFYNIGGAIENLQGSLTHNISDVTVGVSDTRVRTLVSKGTSMGGPIAHTWGKVRQRSYRRYQTPVPLFPIPTVPRRPMQYVLLGLLSLQLTKRGQSVLRSIDGTKLSKRVSDKISSALDYKARIKRALLKSSSK